MRGDSIDDRRYYGMGVAARHVGTSADAFRPTGTSDPLSPAYRFLRFKAAFEPARGGMSGSNEHGAAEWHGIFDASYTGAGDYLVTSKRAFFIASQWPMLPVLCILANRVLTITRPAQQGGVGTNGYGGYLTSNAQLLLLGWPASVLGTSAGGSTTAGLPTEQPTPLVTILLPRVPETVLSPGDMITDDLNRHMTIVAAELTDLGWRLNARIAST